MKKTISFKLFLTVLWRGVCQVLRFIGKAFGYKDESTYAKVVWRIFAGCVTGLIALFTGCVFYCFATEVVYDEWIKPLTEDSGYSQNILSNRISYQYMYTSGQGRIYDVDKDKVLLDGVDWVSVSGDGDSLAVFAKDGKRGYLNRFTGEVALPAVFTRAWVFSEGLAAAEKEGELVFIDHSGNVVINKGFLGYSEELDFVFEGGFCPFKDATTGKIGLIDHNGEWALSPEYDNILNSEGFWKTGKNGLEGLYTAKLVPMFPTENTSININAGVIEIRLPDHTAKRYGYDGRLLVDFVIDEVCQLQYKTDELSHDMSETEGLYADNSIYAVANRLQYRVASGGGDDYYGLMSKDGKRITPPLYGSIEAISANRYICQPQGVIIDDDGNVVE